MYGNGPRQPQGILLECTFHHLFNLIILFIEGIFGIGPLLALQFNGRSPLLTYRTNAHPILINHDHLAQHTIIVASFSIVLHKHNLGTFLQDEHFIRRIRTLRKHSAAHCLKLKSWCFEAVQFKFIHLFCLIVMSDQTHIAILLRRIEIRDIPFVQRIQRLIVHRSRTHFIQNTDKIWIILPINMFQFNRHIVGSLEGTA